MSAPAYPTTLFSLLKSLFLSPQVKFSILLFYLKSAGLLLSLTVLALASLMEACTVASGIWLAKWSSANITSTSERDKYLGTYAGIGVAEAFFVLLTCLMVALGAVTASLTLHNGLLTNIMHSPMLFFETTPLGRIVNRFSQDVYVIDETIRRAVSDILMAAFPLLGVVVVVSYVTPLFLTVVLPLGLLYAFIQVGIQEFGGFGGGGVVGIPAGASNVECCLCVKLHRR